MQRFSGKCIKLSLITNSRYTQWQNQPRSQGCACTSRPENKVMDISTITYLDDSSNILTSFQLNVVEKIQNLIYCFKKKTQELKHS